MSGCGCEMEAKNAQQRKVLRLLLLINLTMFFVESFSGIIAQSTALIADSLDMLADAIVYGLSFYAIGKSKLFKMRSAFLSGIFQVTLAFFVLIDVVRKVMMGTQPEFFVMSGIGMIALLANIYCFKLISRYKDNEIHLRASWLFSRNDVIANVSVIIAGFMVNFFDSPMPDLIVALGITLLVLKGGISIIQESRSERLTINN